MHSCMQLMFPHFGVILADVAAVEAAPAGFYFIRVQGSGNGPNPQRFYLVVRLLSPRVVFCWQHIDAATLMFCRYLCNA
jgi:hypothetical protein